MTSGVDVRCGLEEIRVFQALSTGETGGRVILEEVHDAFDES